MAAIEVFMHESIGKDYGYERSVENQTRDTGGLDAISKEASAAYTPEARAMRFTVTAAGESNLPPLILVDSTRSIDFSPSSHSLAAGETSSPGESESASAKSNSSLSGTDIPQLAQQATRLAASNEVAGELPEVGSLAGQLNTMVAASEGGKATAGSELGHFSQVEGLLNAAVNERDDNKAA
jgi:hypothetical protein